MAYKTSHTGLIFKDYWMRYNKRFSLKKEPDEEENVPILI
jgi:hypothetical protein